jgi:hypothetical protein
MMTAAPRRAKGGVRRRRAETFAGHFHSAGRVARAVGMKLPSSLAIRLLFIAPAFGLAGCSTRVTNTTNAAYAPPAVAATPAPAPTEILVAFSPASFANVQLDTSPGAVLQRQQAGLSIPAAQAKDVQDVQSAISDTLVQKIQSMGLQAQPVGAGALPPAGSVMVTGQITAIAEGNRARRTVVGFGAGASAVQGTATLVRVNATGGYDVLQSFNLSASSGRMPGMGVGVAAGGASAVVSGAGHAAGEVERSPVGQQAASIADHLAGSLGSYFAAQGWISPNAVPSQLP